MNDIITAGTQNAFEAEEGEGEEGDEEEEEDEEEEGEEDEDPKGNKPRAAGSRGIKWKALEDKCLCDSWAVVSMDPITGANQTSGAYWGRIKKEFDERKIVTKEYAVMQMKRSQKALSNRWGIIQHTLNLFCACVEQVLGRPESGTNLRIQVSVLSAMFSFRLCVFSPIRDHGYVCVFFRSWGGRLKCTKIATRSKISS